LSEINGESTMKHHNLRLNNRGVSPVIAVILMVAITVVMSGLLWAMLNINTAEPKAVNLTATPQEKINYWKLTITAVSKNNFNIEDVEFNMIDKDGVLIYRTLPVNSNPTEFDSGLSKVYAMSNNGTVLDSTTGNPVDASSSFEDYKYCYIAFVDIDADQRVNEGDTIYVFKDYNNDGNIDILPIYKFRIFIDNEIAFDTKL
jgi:flagellin-like protein